MAKEDYLEGYGQGLKRGKENIIIGPINKTLDKALGNPHESAKRGIDQGYNEMQNAIKQEKEKSNNMMKKEQVFKMGGLVKEYGGKEVYANKKAMGKHEKTEPAKKEKSEGYKMGGVVKVKGKNC